MNSSINKEIQQVVKELEKSIHSLPFIEKSGIIVTETEHSIPPVHLNDLFPDGYFEAIRNPFIPDSILPKSAVIEQEAVNLNKPAISYGAPLDIEPSHPATLQQLLKNAANMHGSRGITFISRDGLENFYSYAELLHEAQCLLYGLKEQGLQPGDSVIFQFKDNKKIIISFWACVLGGFLPTPIAIAPIYSEMNALLTKIYNSWCLLGRPVILSELELEPKLAELEVLWNESTVQVACFEKIKANAPDTNWFEATADSFVLNLLTSGSTGIPKCVQHRNSSIIWRTIATSVHNQFNHQDISLNWMPLDHVGGIVMFHVRDVYLGCTQVIGHIDSVVNNPLIWLDWIDKHRATLTWAPNFAFSMLNDAVATAGERNWDLSSMRYVLNGGEAVVGKVAHHFLNLLKPFHLPGNALIPAYGMSETSSGIVESNLLMRDTSSGIHYIDKNSLNGTIRHVSADNPNHVVFTESGTPIPGVALRIVDSANTILNEGNIGRLQVSSPTIMNGYYKNDKANQESFIDGWFETGDLGFLIDGRLTVTGRAKDVIIINGNNHYNYDIEAAIEEIDGIEVTYVAACAIPDEHHVDQLAIFFVPDQDSNSQLPHMIDKIKNDVSRKFGLYPAIIVPLSKAEFPKTNSGKIQRNELIQKYQNGDFISTKKQIDILLRNENTLPDWSYRQKWISCELGETETSGMNAANTIVFAKSLEETPLALQEGILILKGEKFRQIDSRHYYINPANPVDYQYLMDCLAEEDFSIECIVHLWNTGPKKEIGSVHDLKEAQLDTSISLLYLSKALKKCADRNIQLFMVTSQAVGASENEPVHFEQATIPGLIKTISHELPFVYSKQIDITGNDNMELMKILDRESVAQDQNRVVAYRNHCRLIPVIEKMDMLTTASCQLPFKKQGLYIVTGGLGGIGLLVCEQLLEQYAANILVIGRTLLTDPQKKEAFEGLKNKEIAGGTIRYETALLTDHIQISNLIAEFEAEHEQSLSGIIHLAGIIQEYLMEDQTQEQLDEMYEAKVYGTWVLHQLVKDKKDILFISSSSARTLRSGMTVGAYCSANQFMEIFTTYQNQSPHMQAYCFSWSLWDELGMGSGLIIKNQLGSRGYSPINKQNGILSLWAGLRSAEPVQFIGLNGAKKEIQELSHVDLHPVHQITIFIQTAVEFDQHALNDGFKELAATSAGTEIAVIELKRMERIPLDETGEVDLRMLAELSTPTRRAESSPRNDLDQTLIMCWKRILKDSHITIDDHFFELGGNSLQATQLISVLRSEIDVQVELEDLFNFPELKVLSDVLNERLYNDQRGNVAPVVSRVRGSMVKMSSAQKRQWVLYELEPNNPFYNNTVCVHVKGRIHTGYMEQAFQEVIRRHDILRTTFDVHEDQSVQIIQPQSSIKTVIRDLSSMGEESLSEIVDTLIQKESMLPFDLVNGPVCRFQIIRTGEDHCTLIISIHHIVSDGWSVGVLLQEFSHNYFLLLDGHPLPAEELEIQYADFALWQEEWFQSDEHHKQMAYWKKQLEGELPVLDLPTDKPRPDIQTYRGTVEVLQIGKGLTEHLKRMAQEEGATLYMVLLAGFAALLKRYSNQDELLMGSLFANRNRREVEPLIGFFTNTLPLRLTCQGTFREFLKDVKSTVLDAQRNQDIQFEEIIEHLNVERDPSRHPLFQTMFVLQNAPMEPVTHTEARMEADIYYNETSKFDLSMQVFEDKGELKVVLEYSTDLYVQSSMQRMLKHYRTLLEGAVSAPSRAVDSYEVITPEEKLQILEDWQSPLVTQEVDHGETLVTLFERAVRETPDSCALIYEGERMTYSELNTQSNKLASFLLQQGLEQDEIIGIMTERSFMMIISILAVLKAGCAYMPVDPAFPVERISYMIDDSRVRKVLVQNSLADKVSGVAEAVDLDNPEIYAGDGENINVNLDSKQLAYVIYTSGTTGKPKGVMIEHASVVNIISDLQDKYPLEKTDAYLFKTPVTFDVSVAELFGWFHRGGSLVILKQGEEKEPLAILKAIYTYGITHINFVPSMLNAFMNSLEAVEYRQLLSLKYVFAAGEAISRDTIRQFYSITDKTRLENIYGPTESTIYATRYSLDNNQGSGPVPIGSPMRNIGILIVNSCNQLQPIGVIGELCIGGAGLARGYINNEKLSREKFVDHPLKVGSKLYRTGDLARWTEEGQIEYLGRIDHQVKIRGIRIELSEIETTILQHEEVKECVVTTISDSIGNKRLAAYLVLSSELSMDWPEYLRDRLPEYMIPHYFVKLDALPTNASGKTDRKALPEPEANSMKDNENYLEPADETEQILAGVWEELLGVTRVGRSDDFFKLGGDSIAIIQMISRLRKQGYRLEPKAVYRNKTIAQLGRKITKTVQNKIETQVDVTGEIKLTPIQQWFFNENFSNPEHWNLSAFFTLAAPYPEHIIKQALLDVINHHDGLRISFSGNIEDIRQINQPIIHDILMHTVDCTGMSLEAQNAVILEESNRAQQSMKLDTSLLIRPVLFKCCDDTQKLLLVVHHLIVDGVSWRIIAEDLRLLLDAKMNNEQVELMAKTTSFKEWAEAQHNYAQGTEIQAELPYWKRTALSINRFAEELFHDFGVENDGTTISVVFNKDYTHNLLRTANQPYNTDINDLLLTALYRATRAFSGNDTLSVMLEGHGREYIVEDLDVTRTVGWFTSAYPVVLKENSELIGQQVKGVKETLRAVPNKGIGYGILKYLTRDAELCAGQTPSVLFNYLGQMDGSSSFNMELASESNGNFHSPAAKRSYLLELNSMVIHDELIVRISVTKDMVQRGMAAALVSYIEQEVIAVADHCVNEAYREFTASDFPLADLSLDELSKIPASTEDVYPLSPMQQGMLYHALSDDVSSSYSGRIHAYLDGMLVPSLMQTAWEEMADRHPILRTTYLWEGRTEPVQLVRKNLSNPIECIRVNGEEEREQQIQAFTNRAFNLENEAPVRIMFLGSESDQNMNQLICSFHHIALDGWSVFALLSELLGIYDALYNNRKIGLSHVPHYKEYIQWYLTQDRHKAKEFWREYLKGIKVATPLPGVVLNRDGETSPQIRDMTKLTYTIQSGTTELIQQFTRQQPYTLNTLLQAAWGLLLSRYTGKEDVLYGCTVSGRPHTIPDVEKMIGLFINSLPLRVNLTQCRTTAELLENLQTSTLDIKEYEYSLLPEIQEVSTVPFGEALFHSLLIYQNYPVDTDMTNSNRALKLDHVQGSVDINYDLIIEIAPRDQSILFEVYYNQSLWDQDFIDRLFYNFENVLKSLVMDCNQNLADILVLSTEESETILRHFANNVKVEVLYEDQEEIYKGVNDPEISTEVYILDPWQQPVPIGIPGEICVASDDLYRDCGSWAEWMTEHEITHFLAPTSGKRLYKTGDIGMWQGNGTIKILDLV
ncbi:amino acid adenylation domain-containing protein [Paenibacillus polysaccharolyticus]|uniref:non-ribosomal peptide synthetase n=1 Tax=Paenibacillus polysaccharolyticus TaxID=582692 RepID=UPI00203F0389|nr:non-ribosomal peptide synthetase [Paenibacillus polysaccharolyticus]MCM3132974.1 amino acid adenylation domain-containing protein [Paenibacillus polysaccharolyticus]